MTRANWGEAIIHPPAEEHAEVAEREHDDKHFECVRHGRPATPDECYCATGKGE
jgi:hypothetical protein